MRFSTTNVYQSLLVGVVLYVGGVAGYVSHLPTNSGALRLAPFVPSRSSVSRIPYPSVPLDIATPLRPSTSLSAGASQSSIVPTKSIVSAAAFCVLDVAFRRGFLKANVSFPSSLGGCGILLALLLALPRKTAGKAFSALKPGADVLAKWLPVFFVPSLVTLPLADSLGSSAELAKVAAVIVGGFLFTLVTTSASVVAVRSLLSGDTNRDESPEEALPKIDAVSQEAIADGRDPFPTIKPFDDPTATMLYGLTVFSGLAAAKLTLDGASYATTTPLTALFMLSSTLASFVWGARLPKALTKVFHPLVTCTSLTWAAAAAFARVTGRSFASMLQSYRTGSLGKMAGAGDWLLFLLGPAVVSLAVSMYDRRKLMRENIPEVGISIGVSTFGGLFGTAWAVRFLSIGNPAVRLSLLSRNITSPLAMSIASILGGADVSLAVSMVVITGLIGANFGATLLDALGIRDAVARGLGMGAAAHGLGTAAIVNEKDAFPFAAISMALTASAATVAVSVPAIRRVLVQTALGSL